MSKTVQRVFFLHLYLPNHIIFVHHCYNQQMKHIVLMMGIYIHVYLYIRQRDCLKLRNYNLLSRDKLLKVNINKYTIIWNKIIWFFLFNKFIYWIPVKSSVAILKSREANWSYSEAKWICLKFCELYWSCNEIKWNNSEVQRVTMKSLKLW